MKKLFIILFLLLPLSQAYASSQNYFGVLLKSNLSKPEAIRLAKTASSRLESGLAVESLEKTPLQPRHLGIVLQIYKNSTGSYDVLSFLGGTQAETNSALRLVQKKFPKAKSKRFSLDAASLDPTFSATVFRRVLILGSDKEYGPALLKAKALSKKTGIPYYSRGLIFDKQKGLIWPPNFSDDIYAGEYLSRRSNFRPDSQKQNFISIERSGFYQNFTPGLYIIVAGIYQPSDAKLQKQLQKLKAFVPDAYSKLSPIYMGCVH